MQKAIKSFLQTRNNNQTDFQFHLAPNFEFMQEILGRGAEAEVLSPQPLRDKFADIIAKLHAKYTK